MEFFTKISLACFILAYRLENHDAQAMPCNTPRRAHPFDSRRFYYCINLFPPHGGHVWVPSMCHEGMVFNAILNMCVLVNADLGEKYTVPDSPLVSSLGRPPASPHLNVYKLNKHNDIFTIPAVKILEKENCETATQISNEVEKSKSEPSSSTETIDSAPLNPIQHSEKTQENSNKCKNFKLKNSIQLNKNDSMKDYIVHNESPESESGTHLCNSDQSILDVALDHNTGVFETTEQESDFSNNIYLTFQSLNNDKSDLLMKKTGEPLINNKDILNNTPNTPNHLYDTVENVLNGYTVTANAADSTFFNRLKASSMLKHGNEVHFLIGHGNSFTSIDNYKSSILPLLRGNTLSVIPCTTGVRMPNVTDCMKYYVCNASAGTVKSYSCPPHTAFNYYKHICDAKELKVCQNKLEEESREQGNVYEDSVSIEIENYNAERETMNSRTDSNITTTNVLHTTVCTSSGKFLDPSSRKHYYLCVRSYPSGFLKGYRMECPNSLVFCASQNICKQSKSCLK